MPDDKWAQVRQQFQFIVAGGPINLAALTIASNPAPVREAVEHHRHEFNSRHWEHLLTMHDEEEAVCRTVSNYFGVPHTHVALTTGTTLGLALMYGGIKIGRGQEILTTEHEFSGALEILRLRAERDAVPLRRLPLMPDPARVSVDAVLGGLKRAVSAHTRVLALTWVYSNSGVKMPIREIAAWLSKDVNADRPPNEKVLLCVDGVHGFGIESTSFPQMGCDFFVSGCHKWIFGPRGTGIWCGTDLAWEQYQPIIASSSRDDWPGLRNTPGGVHSYEHWWALPAAFGWLQALGRADIAERVHRFASDVKHRLAECDGVTVVTPMSPQLSSGLVCFDVKGKKPDAVVRYLREKNIVATVSSSDAGRGDVRHVRLSIALFNTEDELDECMRAVESLTGCRDRPPPQ